MHCCDCPVLFSTKSWSAAACVSSCDITRDKPAAELLVGGRSIMEWTVSQGAEQWHAEVLDLDRCVEAPPTDRLVTWRRLNSRRAAVHSQLRVVIAAAAAAAAAAVIIASTGY